MNEKQKAAKGKQAANEEQKRENPVAPPQHATPEPTEQAPKLQSVATQDTFQWDAVRAQFDLLGDPQLTTEIMASMATIMRESLSQPEGKGWQIYTMADAYLPRPPVDYLVTGLFKLPSLSVMYGPPGCLKTMLLVDLAACVARGAAWLPPLSGKGDVSALATRQGPVLWCDFDNGVREMHERLEAAGRGHGLNADHPLNYVSMPTPMLDATNPESMDYLGLTVKELGAKLLIVDNLGNVSGRADENSSDMGNVLSRFRQLAEDTGTAVVLIHHQRKGNGVKGRKGDTLRGHSSIEAALDLALLVEREEHAETIKLRATKVRGADVLPFGATFTYEHKPGTTELAKVKFCGQLVEDLTSDAAIKRTVIEIVGENPKFNKGNLTDKAKALLPQVGVNRIRDAIDHLTSDGKLVQTLGDNNAKLYDLPQQRDGALAEL